MGHALLCDRPYNQVTLPATHASHAIRQNEDSIGTQDRDIASQLEDGVRGFFLDVYPSPTDPSVPQLCFISCSISDNGPLVDTLNSFAEFLNNNPQELLTIVVRNPSNMTSAKIAGPFKTAGLDLMAETGPSEGNWATVEDMISRDKRVVILSDKGVTSPPKWMHPMETYSQGTQYVVPPDDDWPLVREPWNEAETPFFIIYHMRWQNATVDGNNAHVPYAEALDKINGWDLTKHIGDVRSSNMFWPHLIVVDFYHEGRVMDTALNFNGLVPKGTRMSDFYPPSNGRSTATTSSEARWLMPSWSSSSLRYALVLALTSTFSHWAVSAAEPTQVQSGDKAPLSQRLADSYQCSAVYGTGKTLNSYRPAQVNISFSGKSTAGVSLAIFNWLDQGAIGIPLPDNPKTRQYICTQDAIEASLCQANEYGKILVNQPDHTTQPVLTRYINLAEEDPDHLANLVSYQVNESGIYCVNVFATAHFTGEVQWHNPY
ncbi:hypothetical protein IWQ62_004271, partial [Dispira parvispora]